MEERNSYGPGLWPAVMGMPAGALPPVPYPGMPGLPGPVPTPGPGPMPAGAPLGAYGGPVPDGAGAVPQPAAAETGPVPVTAVPAAGGSESGLDEERIMAEVKEFLERHPRVDLGKLLEEQSFRDRYGRRLYHEPLLQLCEEYLALQEEERQSREEDKRQRTTGSGGGSVPSGLTPREQKELSEWNRAYPHMRMSAKEFLSR